MRWPWRKRHHGLSCKAMDYHAAMLEERCQHQVVIITQLRSQLSNLHARLIRLEQEAGIKADQEPSLWWPKLHSFTIHLN